GARSGSVRGLGVFVGGFTLVSAQAVCDGESDVLKGVSSLIDKSLVVTLERSKLEPLPPARNRAASTHAPRVSELTRGGGGRWAPAALYVSSSSRPSAVPASCTTLRRNSYWVLTSRSAMSIAASTISRRRDGRSPCGNAGNASSTTSTNLRTASIATRDPDSSDLSTSSESSEVRSICSCRLRSRSCSSSSRAL